MNDGLEDLRFYKKALDLWNMCWNDTEILKNDFRGKEVARQLIRSCGSISANIEEGYGRGFGREYPHFLRIARGSARESKGWYQRSKYLLPGETIDERCTVLDGLIAMITKSIKTLENKKK
jgi:four helix bundle protein